MFSISQFSQQIMSSRKIPSSNSAGAGNQKKKVSNLHYAVLLKHGFNLSATTIATNHPIKESTKKSLVVSQSESDDSWADTGMVAVDPSKVKVKVYQKRACSKAPATSTPNAEDHKMAHGHQFTNNQSSVKDVVNTPKMEVKADMKSINSKAPAASTPVKLHSEMTDNESKYNQRLPKKMESCLKDLERQVEADLRAKAMEKAIESSKVETSDHCLQNESSEFSKERGVSSFKTPNKLMFPTSRKPVENEWNSTKCVIKLTKSP